MPLQAVDDWPGRRIICRHSLTFPKEMWSIFLQHRGSVRLGAMTTKKPKPAYFVPSHQVLDRETLNEIYVPKAVDCLIQFDVGILVVSESV